MLHKQISKHRKKRRNISI